MVWFLWNRRNFFIIIKRKKCLHKIEISRYIFTLVLFVLRSYKFQVYFNLSKCLARNHQFWIGQRNLFQSTLKSGENFCLFQLLASVTYFENFMELSFLMICSIFITLWYALFVITSETCNHILLVKRIAAWFFLK